MSGPRSSTLSPLGGRRAYAVWGVALSAYVLAVFHRYTLGVAGIDAAHRFHVSAGALGVLSFAQLTVYAAMQVPVGMLLDRFGSRRLITVGALVMALAQLGFAFSTDLPSALAFRMLLGLGDALTFISVLRLVTAWFPARRNPFLTQLTGQIGAAGAIVASFPLIRLLHSAGWVATFGSAATAGLVVAVLASVVVRDSPAHAAAASPPRPSTHGALARLRTAWQEPGTRLGLWTHFVTQFPATVFGLLWGYPFLVIAQGLSSGAAATLLTVMTVTGVVSGPFLGHLVGAYPLQRSNFVLAVVGTSVAAWTAVLAWPGHAPPLLLVVLVVVMGVNGPGSMIGFDFARTYNPAHRLGSASGIVNVGGFVASLTTVLLIGLVVDVFSPRGGYAPGALRAGFCVQYAVWALGAAQVLRHRVRLRRSLAARAPAANDAPRNECVARSAG